jgi:RsiW-degrading membrane proteinase PrsW (M82 family)
MLPSVATVGYAFLGGILPALIWLYFLLKEDSRCPEPRTLISVAFMAGMFAVPVVLPLETFSAAILPDGTPVIIAWAAIEETMKFVLAALFVLWRREVNESIDLVIYMLTVALGFAALENTLFLLQPFSDGHFLAGLATDDLRFVGSTLLHVIASSAIGFALAFSYKAPHVVRAFVAILGLILAITLHAVFNFFIIDGGGSHTLLAFFIVWTGLIVLFALFEVLKIFRYRNSTKNVC